jgi:hypothetical protein
MFAAALVTLKLHRFELAAAVIAALAVAFWALVTESRLDALNAPQACVQDWLNSPNADAACAGVMHSWGQILGEAEGLFEGEGVIPLSAMGMLPFAMGLLGGVPIVAAELEGRTAQTAWSLSGSRVRWLIRQIAPVGLLLGASISVAALTAGAVVGDDIAWGTPAWIHIGIHGPLVLIRTFSAFGLGLMVGALVGRTLPAFILGAALSFAILFGVGIARDGWLDRLPPIVIGGPSQTTGEPVMLPRAETTGWAWRTPDGQDISMEQGLARVPKKVSMQDADTEPGSQPAHSLGWLYDQGYLPLVLGVTEEMALGWQIYDGLAFGAIGVLSVAGTGVLVNRRRPV